MSAAFLYSYDASMLDHSMQMKQVSSPSETDVFSYPLISVNNTKVKQVELSWDVALCLFSRPNYFLTQPLSPTHSPSSVSLRFNPPVPTATACFRGNYKVLLVFLLHRPQRVPQARECSCVVSLCMAIRTICLIMFLETGYQFVLYSSLSKFWGDISESTRRC